MDRLKVPVGDSQRQIPEFARTLLSIGCKKNAADDGSVFDFSAVSPETEVVQRYTQSGCAYITAIVEAFNKDAETLSAKIEEHSEALIADRNVTSCDSEVGLASLHWHYNHTDLSEFRYRIDVASSFPSAFSRPSFSSLEPFFSRAAPLSHL